MGQNSFGNWFGHDLFGLGRFGFSAFRFSPFGESGFRLYSHMGVYTHVSSGTGVLGGPGKRSA
jgi:hypothetical protein